MKKLFTALLLLITALTTQVRANHLLGGEINYRFVSQNGNIQTYEVTLSFFADCASNIPNSAFPALINADPEVFLYQGNNRIATRRLAYNAALSNIEITPVCPDEAQNTSCININNPIPGIKRFVYNGTFTLTGTSNDWRFRFEASITDNGLSMTSAGRSMIIQNAVILDPATSNTSMMALEATLNNTTGPNSSTTYTSLPTPFFCLNKAATYSLGAADPENDQLVFSLIPAKQIVDASGAISDVTYIAPFTATKPLPADTGNFSFNGSNGQMNFTPNQVMNCLVTNLVEEYRNGVRVGSSMREMTFVILDNCSNDAPISMVSAIENADIISENSDNLVLSVCEGQVSDIEFDIRATDPNGDNTTITFSNLPEQATLDITGNGTDDPGIHFNWNVTDAAPGNYIFYVTYTDDGCPLVSTRTIAYMIQVLPHPVPFDSILTATCEGSATGSARIFPEDPGVTIPYTYSWYNSSGTEIRSVNSTSGDGQDNLAAGTYLVRIRNAEGCGTNISVTIASIPLPELRLDLSDTTLCAGMPLALGVPAQQDVIYRWNTGDTTCCIVVTEAGSYVLTASNLCGSVSGQATIRYVKCNFCLFVPNAFSPNGDGQNDQFNVLQTCVLDKYQLRIFNRWGQLVFTTLSTGKGWDGTYKGSPADGGVYFYYIDALPADRSKGTIQLKGDITLIR